MTDHPEPSKGRNRREKNSRHAVAIEALPALARALVAAGDIQAIPEQIMIQTGRRLNPKAWSLLRGEEKPSAPAFTALLSDLADYLNGMRLPSGDGVAGCCSSDTGVSR